MANLTRNFTLGKMNKVVDERLVPNGEYIDAMNARMGSTEQSEIGVIENTKGNLALTALSYFDGTPISVDATCIGAFADSANETVYWFVHDPNFTNTSSGPNPTGKLDLIVSFNTLTNILTYHIISIDDGGGVNTTLNFNSQYLITGVNKIGDLLFFTEDYNQPRFINVLRNYPNPVANIDGGGSPDGPSVLAESILVIKRPPVTAPTVELIDQAGQNNYLDERFICFAYRYRYIDGEYSATSQWSDPAFSPSDFAFTPNSYLNEGMTNAFNAAVVSYETGGPLVVGIDLLFKQANNNIIKVIEKLDKAEMGIPNDITQTFTFNNSKIFTILPESEILRLYDNVPRLAKAQTIMGNRLMYGAYLEGYDLVDKFGNPIRLEYETELLTNEIGFEDLSYTLTSGNYNFGSGIAIADSVLRLDLSDIDLIAGSSITIEAKISHTVYNGDLPNPTDIVVDLAVNFSFVLPVDYPSVYALVTSVEFQNAIGTSANILPVYSPIPGDDTSCDGTTFTDQVNCLLPQTLATPNAFGSVTKYASGIDAAGEPMTATISSPSSTIVEIQLIAMQYVDDVAAPIQNVYDYYRFTEIEAYYQKVSTPRSLHSNRGYEIGIVYMDEFNRASTALVSPFNTEYVACGNSVTKNSIRVLIPTSMRAPGWAKRYKFVCKADTENYETIYTSVFFTEAETNDVYFLLEGENMRKVENGDRYIVKRDTGGALLTCAYATVLEKEAKQAGFITTQEGVAPPAGVYMKMKPDSFQATQGANSIIDPGQITTNENNGGEFPIQDYPMNIWDGSAWVDYTVPAGSRIRLRFKFQRLGPGDGNRSCERRIYTLEVTLTSSANYDNMYDWWVGDNVAAVLNTGTEQVGGSGNCGITNVFIPTLGVPTPDVCINYFRFYRYSNNKLVLKISGTVRCAGVTGGERRKSTIISEVTVFRADNLLVFETLPTDTLPDIFFENELSFPISDDGDHLSDMTGDISQDIATGTPGIIQTGFFNCFTFGNGIESYKIRDSLIGRSFNLGSRVTSVSAQDYKAADRYADITYSGVYNQETNVNRLNEFNLGLLNFKNLEVLFGRIFIIDSRDTDVLVLQEDKISYVLAGKNLLSDSTGGGVITSVPEVLGTQIARTEKYGISFNPESYVHWGFDRFFTDAKRGAVIQLRGSSASQEQLNVISELGMRTWFRDQFIDSFNTQKLGGYDPYMNEYVLSANDIQLPGAPECVACGVSQTLTLSQEGEEEKLFEYCVSLGQNIGVSTISWVVESITGEFTISVNYDSSVISDGPTDESGSISFLKNFVNVNTAAISITYTGDVVLSIIADCPVPSLLNVVQVVITSDSDAGKTIHAQYRYTDGTFVGPLQSSIALFQTGASNPLVSLYSMSTGYQGAGGFPTDSSDVTISTNKIVPDDFDFDILSNNFRYLRTTALYDNNPVDISALIAASSLALPISNLGSVFSAQFPMPPSGDGDYLYLIYDLRKSSSVMLCYTNVGSEPSLKELCCDCAPCGEACIELSISNISESQEAKISLSLGLCGDSEEAVVTLSPSETVVICVNNAPYSVVQGDAAITELACGCTGCDCQQYVLRGGIDDASTVEYYDCTTSLLTSVTMPKNEGQRICTDILATPPYVVSGTNIIQLTNPCGCCESSSCVYWRVTNEDTIPVSITLTDCATSVVTLLTLAIGVSIEVCAPSTAPPHCDNSSADVLFEVLSDCGCPT